MSEDTLLSRLDVPPATDVGCGGRQHFRVSALSGGMKRKLSVAIAFSGRRLVSFAIDYPAAAAEAAARLEAERPAEGANGT